MCVKLPLKTKALTWGYMLQEEDPLQSPEWAPAQVVGLLISPTTRWVATQQGQVTRCLSARSGNLPTFEPTCWCPSQEGAAHLVGRLQPRESVGRPPVAGTGLRGAVEVLERRLDLREKGTVRGSPCPALLGTHACAHGQPAPGRVPYK